MMSVLMSIVLFTAPIADSPAAGQEESLTIPVLRQKHGEFRTRLHVVERTEDFMELRPALTDERQNLLWGETVNALGQHAEAAKQAAPSDAAREQMDNWFRDRVSGVDGAVRASALNRSLAMSRTILIDFQRGRMRCQTVDQRDLNRLQSVHGLDEASMIALDQTGTTILDREKLVRVNPRAGNLAIVSDTDRFREDEQWLALGVLPAWVFSDEFRLELRETVPTVRSCVELVGKRGADVVFRAQLEQEHGWRASGFTTFSPSGAPFCEYRMNAYREIDGTKLPFEFSSRTSVSDKGEYILTRARVREIRFQRGEPEEASFAIPPDCHIQDTRRPNTTRPVRASSATP